MENIFIFGHKNPDTDSVVSSIALSYLKNAIGEHTTPRVLGAINNETRFALNYFGVKEPVYLNDVKLQLKDVNYNKGYFLSKNSTVLETYAYMADKGLTGVPIVDEKNKFVGLLTIKNLAKEFIGGDINRLETSYDNILKSIDGVEVLRFDDEIIGNLLVASYRSTTFMEYVTLTKDDVVIVGDRPVILNYAVTSGVKLIILVGNCKMDEESLELAKTNHVNIIRTPLGSYPASKQITLSNYISTMLEHNNPIVFDQMDYLDDFLEINSKMKHTNYPILNRKGECLGLLRVADLNEKNRKKVILVDHNEKMQSVDGLDEAEILEIVDHHNISPLATPNPINFRNMAVGSTSTILYTLYKERNIEVPKEIAGLMLSGVLSDTLLFKSPTTTDLDKEAVEYLAPLAGVDYEKYGMEMLKAGTSLKGKSHEDVLYTDFKKFTINDETIAVAQIMTMNFDEIKEELDTYVELLNRVAVSNNYYFVVLFATDIIKNGSYVIYSDKAKRILELGYGLDEIEQGHYFEGIVSRKKQIIPYIMDAMDTK